MAYEWLGPGSLTRVGGEDIEPGDTFEPSESEQSAFGGKMEAVADDESEEPEPANEPDESDTESGSEDTPLADKEYSELRDMAVEADTNEINGRSSKDEIIAYFEE